MTRTYVVTGSASGIGAATKRALDDQGHRVIGVDLRDADVEADLSTRDGRTAAVARVLELSGGVVDGVIACAGISAPVPVTISVNYFGVTEVLTGLLPALRASSAPRAAVVSSIASIHPNAPEVVEAALAGDEAAALASAEAPAAQGPEAGYLVYPSSKRALSRWVRRESIGEDWAGSGIPLNAVAPAP